MRHNTDPFQPMTLRVFLARSRAILFLCGAPLGALHSANSAPPRLLLLRLRPRGPPMEKSKRSAAKTK